MPNQIIHIRSMRWIFAALLMALLSFAQTAMAQERVEESQTVAAIQALCDTLHTRYPAANLQDLYKTCYQDYFGAEHLMRDTAAAREYLHRELTQCSAEDLSLMPLSEPTGFRHRYTRINLRNILLGTMSEDELLRKFIEAASDEHITTLLDSGGWAAEWRRIAEIATARYPQWQDEELEQALNRAAEQQAAVRHSQAFRDTYKPHYRIIRL